jgi:hypothetical protein
MKSFYQFFWEKFTDIGKLSPEQLKVSRRLTPEDANSFKEVDWRRFYKIINAYMNADTARSPVDHKEHDWYKDIKNNITIYEPKEYSKMKCFIGPNNTSGYCIKDGDELVSVFSAIESSGDAIVKSAIKNGAKRLDCFAEQDGKGNILPTKLFKLYSRNGFVIDTDKNYDKMPYPIYNGISYYVDDDGNIDRNNKTVVVYMKLGR